MSKLFDLVAGALWKLACEVEDFFSRHDPKRKYP